MIQSSADTFGVAKINITTTNAKPIGNYIYVESETYKISLKLLTTK